MPQRRQDIYAETAREIQAQFPGDELRQLAHLYRLPALEAARLKGRLIRLERSLAKKYRVTRATVTSQTARFIETLRQQQES
jgi:Mor family transcriptional regulator